MTRKPGDLPSAVATQRRRWGGKETIMSARTLANADALGSSKTEMLRASLLAFSLGLALVYLAGFAFPETAHNAAHDTRHALSFPCH